MVKASAPPKAISHTSHADDSGGTVVYQQLREWIVSGRLPPNVRVAEGPLASALGTSRMPVREAMQRLRHEGLLIPVGGGAGVRVRLAVAPFSREQMEELYRLAAALEGLAARNIATFSSDDRTRLAKNLESAERAFHAEAKHRSPDFDRLFVLHQDFHRKLLETAAGPETRSLLAVIAARLDRYEWFYAPLIGPDFSATRAEHAAIIQAVRKGNAAELERTVRANWVNAAERLGPIIENSLELGMSSFIPRR